MPSIAKDSPAGPVRTLSLRERITDGELGGFLLLAPAMLVLLALTVWPLLYSVGVSFTDLKLGETGPVHMVGAANYLHLLHDGTFLGSLLVTAKLLIIAVPLQLVLGYLCAAVLSCCKRHAGCQDRAHNFYSADDDHAALHRTLLGIYL